MKELLTPPGKFNSKNEWIPKEVKLNYLQEDNLIGLTMRKRFDDIFTKFKDWKELICGMANKWKKLM